MGQLQLNKYTPKLNPLKSEEYWLNKAGAPKPWREREQPRTRLLSEVIDIWGEL
jgi:glycerol transport system substrate-binding protein